MSAIDEKIAVPELPTNPSQTSSSSIDEKHANELDNGSVGASAHDLAKADEGVDVVVGLLSGHADDEDVDPEVSRRVRNKMDWNMLPLLFVLYTRQCPGYCCHGAASVFLTDITQLFFASQCNSLTSEPSLH